VLDMALIKEWTRLGGFPRHWGLYRSVVKSYDEVESLWGDGRDKYFSIFSVRQMQEEVYDTVGFDVESKEHNDIHKNYDNLKQVLSRLTKFPKRVYFSGRGFWVFLDLKKYVKGKAKYKSFCRRLAEQYDLIDYLDLSSLGDASRMARIPSSINSSTGFYMVEISEDFSLSKILYNAKWNISYLSGLRRVDIDVDLGEKEVYVSDKIENVVEWKGSYPPCIENAIMSLNLVGELDHTSRRHLASFMLRIGREDELRELLKKANDYQEHITEYQIEDIKKRELLVNKCVNVTGEICPFKNKRDCVYYPSINHVLEALVE